MLDFLTDSSYYRDLVAFIFTFYQAGFYMIPTLGWKQAIEAWASDKIKE